MRTTLRSIITLVIIAGIMGTSVLWAQAPTSVFVTPTPTRTNITIGWVGDMVPNSDPDYNYRAFRAVQHELEMPDLMIGNLEGTFAAADRIDKCIYLSSMCHAFRGDASFAYALSDAGFDFVSLVNNHSYDYFSEGLTDTEAVLDELGIPYISPTKPSTSIVVKGKKVGILGLSSTEPASTITDYDFIAREVAKLEQTNDFVIVIFHGGAEGADKTDVPGTHEYVGTEDRGDVQQVAYTAIDAGADLILGAGPHVLRKIEVYNGAPVAYSLGNFVGGGRLVVNDTLGVSGILTTTLEKDTPTTYDFTSILLTPDGLPALDIAEQGKRLIENLSQ